MGLPIANRRIFFGPLRLSTLRALFHSVLSSAATASPNQGTIQRAGVGGVRHSSRGAASCVAWHGQAQRGHVLPAGWLASEAKHARALGLGMARRNRRTFLETALAKISERAKLGFGGVRHAEQRPAVIVGAYL